MKEEDSSVRRTLAVAVITVSLIVVACWIWGAPNRRIPDELLGEWHTTETNYADRWFEIDPVCISFVTGQGNVSTGFIREVQAVPQGSRTLYTISYSQDGTPNHVCFYYETGKDEVIRFKNQEKIIWIKDKSG